MKIADRIKQIDSVEIPSDIHQLPAVDKLRLIWPIVVIALSIIKIFTGDKADRKIDAALQIGKDIF